MKNKQKQKKQVNSYQGPELNGDLQSYFKHIEDKSFWLGKEYMQFRYKRNDWGYIRNDSLEFFEEWLPYYIQACEVDLLSGKMKQVQVFQKELSRAPSEEFFYKSYDFFQSYSWSPRFAKKFMRRFHELQPGMKKFIVAVISKFLDGYVFSYNTETVYTQELSFMKFFQTTLPGTKRKLVWMIGVERIPEINNKNQIGKFNYKHYMRFLDIITDKEANKPHHVANLAQNIVTDFKKDPARQDFGFLELGYSRNPLFAFEDVITGSVVSFTTDNRPGVKFTPNSFHSTYLSANESQTIIFNPNLNRWVSKTAEQQMANSKYNQFIAQMNRDTLRKYADFKNAVRLVELLEGIPNFKIKLTPEEKAVVGQNGNVLALGRSGTGKTTCAILRLFSMELLFKYRLSLARSKHQSILRDTRFSADDVETAIGLHCVFVTASPVLTNEVSRYYHKLTDQIKEELKKKQERIKEKKRKQAEEERLAKAKEEGKEFEIVTEKPKESGAEEEEEKKEGDGEDEVKLAANDMKDIKLSEDVHEMKEEEENLLDPEDDENEYVKKMNRYQSLDGIDEHDFPLFLTVRRLVMMIDGTLARPFFSRNLDGKIVGTDSNAQWHNEQKGVLMISNYHKKLGNFEEFLEERKKDNESDLSSDSEDDDDFDLNELEDEELEQLYEAKQQEEAESRRAKRIRGLGRRKNQLSFEVEYDYFVTNFWNPIIVKKQPYLLIPPIVVWSEIQSYIKGSANSYEYAGSYIPKYLYMHMDSKKKSFLSPEMKEIIFDIFGRYERWKRNLGAYDFMDVVNYILNQVRVRGYNGAPIHYLMIDEVQDLSHATIMLLMKVTEQGLFFSGDTAQTIAKGVGVRFADLNSLFTLPQEMTYGVVDNAWRKPTVRQLTVNFRSHGKILELANSVVTLIETFFPKTIDKLKKEKSQIDGPKPILLTDVDLDVLFALLFGSENYKKQALEEGQGENKKPPVEFGCNQVILVRDQESKDKLPMVLKHALVLTIYEAKGLEFDDVILYNFFSDSKLTHDQWKILNSIYINDVEIDKEAFEEKFFIYEGRQLDELDAKEDDEEGDEDAENAKKNDYDDVDGDDDEEDDEENEEKEKVKEIGTEKQGGKKGKGKKNNKRPRGKQFDKESTGFFGAQLDPETNKYTIKKVNTTTNLKSFNMTPYTVLCNELKMLYVAITRPKNRLIIYDDKKDKMEGRKAFQYYWGELGLCELVSKKILEENIEKGDQSKDIASFKALITQTNAQEWKKQGIRMFKNKYYEQAMKCFDKSGDKDLKMRAEAYHSAEKAASDVSDINAKRMYMREGLYPYSTYSKAQRKGFFKDLKREEQKALKKFTAAGDKFNKIGLIKQAAQCYFSANNYSQAYETYIQLGQNKQAGECCFQLKRYDEAALLFDKGGDYVRAIECYDKVGKYEEILECVNRHIEIKPADRETYAKKYVPLALEKLVSKVDYNIADVKDEEDDKNNKKKKPKKPQQSRIGVGYRIDEVDEEEEEYNSDEDVSSSDTEEDANDSDNEKKPAETKKGDENVEQKDTQEQNPNEAEEKKVADDVPEEKRGNLSGFVKGGVNNESKNNDISNMSFSEIKSDANNTRLEKVSANNTIDASEVSFEVIGGGESSVAKSEKPKDNISEMSFSEIGSVKGNEVSGIVGKQANESPEKKDPNLSEISFEDVNIKAEKEEKLENFEHLSHIDPDDEWLQMETGSIAESISSVRKQGSNVYSEFSAIDFNHIMNNQCNLVKTKADIFVQDDIMQKIIRYIGMFSDDVKKSLFTIRSKDTLLSQSTKESDKLNANQEFIDYIVDLDEINIDFVYLILDLLEYYKLYKLCIFVCNRYGLSRKIGRYLVNVASKYSNFASENLVAEHLKLYNKNQRLIQGEKAFVANVALHNVLENINPAFLKLKKKQDHEDASNSLGPECFRELINLGFWKKVLFLMDYQNSLALSATYGSFKNYKIIFVGENTDYRVDGFDHKIQKVDFQYLPFKTPSTTEEIEACLIGLDAVIWDLQEKFPKNLYKYYSPSPSGELEVPTFPSFFAFNGILWQFLVHHTPENQRVFEKYMEEAIPNLLRILNNTDFKSEIIDLRIYDLITFFVQIAMLHNHVPILAESLTNLSDAQFEELMSIFKYILVMTKNILRTSKHQETIMKALITPFRIRFIEQAPVLEHICGSYYLVHMSSTLMNELISNTRSTDYNTSSVIFDIEANFMATPINTVLETIRSRMIGYMRNILGNRMKNVYGTSYSEGSEKLTRLLHVLGLIDCFRFAVDFDTHSVTKKQNVVVKLKYNKTDPLYHYAKSELKSKLEKLMRTQEEIQDFEPAERQILQKKIDRQVKEIKSSLNYHGIRSAPYEEQRVKILQQLKRKSIKYRDGTYNLSPFSRQAVLDFIMAKMKIQFNKNKVKPNYINMFFMLGEEVLLAELIRAFKKNWISATVQQYFDALFYRKYLCIDEYAHHFFEYFAKLFKTLKLPQKVYLLESAATIMTIATALGQGKKHVYLHETSTDFIADVEINGDREYTYSKNVLPCETNDTIFELIYWLEKIVTTFFDQRSFEGESELNKLEKSIVKMTVNVMLNVGHLDEELANKCQTILRTIVLQNPTEHSDYDHLVSLRKAAQIESYASSFNHKANKFENSRIIKLNLKSDLKKAEAAYEKCELQYNMVSAEIAKHISLKARIMKVYDSRRFAKIKNKVAIDFFTNNYIINTFKGVATQQFVVNNMFTLMKKNSGLLDIFTMMNDTIKNVLYFFFHTKVTNPVDFHYIMNLLSKLAEIGVDYSKYVREITIKQDFSGDSKKEFVKRKQEIDEFNYEYKVWKQNKEAKEDLDAKLKKKKKVLGVKWQERDLLSKVSRAVKKKASKKKKAALAAK